MCDSRQGIVKEFLITVAKVCVPAVASVSGNFIFLAATPADSKVPADKAVIAQVLFFKVEVCFSAACGEVFYRRFDNIAEFVIRFHEKITGKDAAGMLNYNIAVTPRCKGTDCMTAGDIIRNE